MSLLIVWDLLVVFPVLILSVSRFGKSPSDIEFCKAVASTGGNPHADALLNALPWLYKQSLPTQASYKVRAGELGLYSRDYEHRGRVFSKLGCSPDFSIIGKNKGQFGDNGKLSAAYIELICEALPDFFLFENV